MFDLTGLQLRKGTLDGKPLLKFGFNSAISTTEETVWDQGGSYGYITTATTLKVSSSNANDDVAGTGARTVQIYGLDEDYNEVNETIDLDGQTAVTTTETYIRVFRAIVRSAGSGGEAAGDIYVGDGVVTAGVPATKYLKVVAGEGQTQMALWTVPAGYTLYLYNASIGTGATAGNRYLESRLVVRPFDEVFQTKGVFTTHNSMYKHVFDAPLAVTEKSDIEWRAKTSSGTDAVTATFHGIYLPN